MRLKSGGDNEEFGQAKPGSSDWHEAQAQAVRMSDQLAGDCHPWVGVVQCGIFLRDPEGKSPAIRFGTAYYCPHSEFDKKTNLTMECFKVLPKYKLFKNNRPSDWNDDVWGDMRDHGPCIPSGGPDFALYCQRVNDILEAYKVRGRVRQWMPREQDLKIDGKIPSHGYARDAALKHNAYVKEYDEPIDY